MGIKAIIGYSLLLLIPAGMLAALAAALLWQQSRHLDSYASEAVREQALLSAESILVAADRLEQAVMEELLNLPSDPAERMHRLMDMERHHPLIRNVFLWKAPSELLVPNAVAQRSGEQQTFAKRYAPLFDGRQLWEPPAEVEQRGAYNLEDPFRSAPNKRQKLINDIVFSNRQSKEANHKAWQEDVSVHAWLPWFEANRLYVLGYVKDDNLGQVYGVELELAAFLSRLHDALPVHLLGQEMYALRDQQGQILFQRGAKEITREMLPDITLSIGVVLPGYDLVVYQAASAPGTSQWGLLLIAGAVLLILALLSLLSVILVVRQVHRHARDAQQKTGFVSSVSHELKTPLTTIRMYAELLGEGRVKDEAKKTAYLGTIIDESERLTRLVNNVLDFGRLESGRKHYNLETLELSSAINDLLERHRPRIEQAGFRLDMALEASWVEADRDALEQILINLIDNAIKYASAGKQISVSTTGGTFRVRDRGPGIGARDKKRIFRRFFRIDDSLTAEQAGSGLGLTLSRQLARGMGGDLTCRDREGGGTEFICTLKKVSS